MARTVGSTTNSNNNNNTNTYINNTNTYNNNINNNTGEDVVQQIGALRKELAGCREEVGALRDCLQTAGVVSSECFLVQLHKRRFKAARALHGLGPCVPLDAVIDIRAVALAVGLFSGPSAIRALREACHGARPAAGEVLDQLCPIYLYVCGGASGTQILNSVERFDPKVGMWETLPPMSARRASVTAAAIAGGLHVFGGQCQRQCLGTAESFDPVYGTWSPLPGMAERRSGAASAAVLL
ncbi:unnamed protein product [Polarella glacialis]|uniref:Uncharacterized protein n=1 Tax=Polarella glacialis TaxID=89957 RepID=A0A813KL44_POLGL|nr:unnamed protein product [Polarella glacialis]